MPTELLSLTPTEAVFLTTDEDTFFDQLFTFTGTGFEADGDDLSAGVVDSATWTIEATGTDGSVTVTEMAQITGWGQDVADLSSSPVMLLSLTQIFLAAQVAQRVPEGTAPDYYPILWSVSGDTSLTGTAGPDAIFGGAQLVSLSGLGGHDLLSSEAADATIRGGSGNDTIDAEGDGASALGGAGDDWLTGGAGGQTLNGQSGNDYLVGGVFNNQADGGDMLIGGLGDDTMYGYGGNDTLIGGPGDDRIQAREDADRVVAGDGRDVMVFMDGIHTASGGAGGDAFVVYTNVGYGPGNSFLAVDRLTIHDFDVAEDVLVLGSNDKTFLTSDLSYTVFMSEAEQVGANTVFDNGETQIVLRGVTLTDLTEENFVRFAEGEEDGWAEWGTVTVTGAAGDDTLRGTSGDDTVLAGLGDDDVRAGGGDDRVIGMGGNDVLRGGHGDDVLSGGAGRDVLLAERGDDTLFGGDGADAFVLFVDADLNVGTEFWQTDVTERAVIADFDVTEDVLMLRESDNGHDTEADRMAEFMEHAEQRGAHVVYDNGVSEVVLLNVDLDDLGAQHFDTNGIGFYDWGDLG